MKNWNSIFMALAAVLAASVASAQDATTTTETTTATTETTTVTTEDGAVATEVVTTDTKGNESEVLEMKTKNGVVKAEKKTDGDKTSVKVTISGIHSQSGIYSVMEDVKKAGDALAGATPIGASAPREDGSRDSGGVKGKYGTVLANKEVSNGKVTVDASVHSISSDVTAADIAEDFLNAIANMVVEDQLQLSGKTVVVTADFAPGTNPAITFTVDIPMAKRESWGETRFDNSINVDDRDVTGI